MPTVPPTHEVTCAVEARLVERAVFPARVPTVEEVPLKSTYAPASVSSRLAELPYLFLQGRLSNRLKCLFLNRHGKSLPVFGHRLSLAHTAGTDSGVAAKLSTLQHLLRLLNPHPPSRQTLACLSLC